MSKFLGFWTIYPKRKGSNPRALAEKKYLLAIKNGANHEHLVSSARKYAEELREQGKYDTEFVCMASTWLNQKRWLDYTPDDSQHDAKIDADMSARGYTWNGERWLKVSPASMKAMDEACKIYNSALESLAKK